MFIVEFEISFQRASYIVGNKNNATLPVLELKYPTIYTGANNVFPLNVTILETDINTTSKS